MYHSNLELDDVLKMLPDNIQGPESDHVVEQNTKRIYNQLGPLMRTMVSRVGLSIVIYILPTT
jgi:hypothetical protein